MYAAEEQVEGMSYSPLEEYSIYQGDTMYYETKPKKIQVSEDRIMDAVKKGVTRRDLLVKVGTNYTKNIDTCVTGAGASMVLSDLIQRGILVERFNVRAGDVEIGLA